MWVSTCSRENSTFINIQPEGYLRFLITYKPMIHLLERNIASYEKRGLTKAQIEAEIVSGDGQESGGLRIAYRVMTYLIFWVFCHLTYREKRECERRIKILIVRSTSFLSERFPIRLRNEDDALPTFDIIRIISDKEDEQANWFMAREWSCQCGGRNKSIETRAVILFLLACFVDVIVLIHFRTCYW